MTFISYAQNSEDVMLWRALKHVESGFYIDVGANDPEIDSVTKVFYERGWRGINIEPLTSHYADLQQARPRDINLNCAAGDKAGEIEIFECDVRGWASADSSTIAHLNETGHVGKYHRVPVATLVSICGEYALGEIHFLKVDVEGFEAQVLAGMDFKKFRPWVVVVESVKPDTNEENHQRWESGLLVSGYQYAYADGLNRFYVADEHTELLRALKYPPNVLDGFVTAARMEAEIRVQQVVARALVAEDMVKQVEARVLQAEARAKQIESQLQQADSQLQQADSQLQQTESQLQQTASQLQQTESQLQQTESQLQQTESKLQQTESQLQQTESQLQQTESKLQQTESKLHRLAQSLVDLQSRRMVRVLGRIARWAELQEIQNILSTFRAPKSLGVVAVDLTPILPGGANGGAKIFVLELLRQLARLHPEVQFILLTQAASHDELAALDSRNMRRHLVIGSVVATDIRPRLSRLASRILPHLPNRLRNVVSRFGYRLTARLKRIGSGALLRNMGADLLFCPFTAPVYFEAGIPTVCTIYDLQYKTYPEFFSAADVAHRDRAFLDACRRATVLTAISGYSRGSAIAHGNLDPYSIRTIYLRMAQRITSGAEHDLSILSVLNLSPQRYLVYPANFWKHKNHEMLFTAFGMACGSGLGSDVKLVCTGAPGVRQEWLQRAAQAMGLRERILFPGYLSNADLAALMANCAGMVFPSLYEGFGLPVIEAMAAGVPVACSNTTSLPEVADQAAVLFDPRIPTQIAQAMTSLVEDASLRAKLIHAGRERAVEFLDTERMAREYWELFQYALSLDKPYENLLTGVYADGWLGGRFYVQVAPAAHAKTLELKFSAPDWLPQSELVVRAACVDGKASGGEVVIKPGNNSIMSLPTGEDGASYEIGISPTFVPSRAGYGDDQRELSVMLGHCRLFRIDGSYIELYPEEKAV